MVHIGEIIYFPEPKGSLSEDEWKEYQEIRRKIRGINGFRSWWHVRKEVKRFRVKIEEDISEVDE